LVASEITNAVKKSGARVFIGENKTQKFAKERKSRSLQPGGIKQDNPELKEDEKEGIKNSKLS
jgi:hypothetical protein